MFNDDSELVKCGKLPVSEQFLLDQASNTLSHIDVGLPEFSVLTINREKKESVLSEKKGEDRNKQKICREGF